jgi:hypothetical protein
VIPVIASGADEAFFTDSRASCFQTGNAALWTAWVVVLVALIAAAAVWLREDHRRGGAVAPWTPGPLLITEGVALVLGLLVAFLVH